MDIADTICKYMNYSTYYKTIEEVCIPQMYKGLHLLSKYPY